MINAQDKLLITQKGLTVELVEKQLKRFNKGFEFLKLSQAASLDHGIVGLSAQNINHLTAVWDDYLKQQHSVVKFVPASGAASRMFKSLFEFLASDSNELPATEALFFDKIKNFAFYPELNALCLDKVGHSIEELMERKEYKVVVDYLLNEKGLNYGSLPKGLLSFHQYKEEIRSPFEEHLVEGALYARQNNGVVDIHYTVSENHEALFKDLLNRVLPIYEKRYGVKYQIEFSFQKASTDTLAVDMDNRPFRVDGQLLFRPGGHGALIENLNNLKQEIIFIKNIDNVLPDRTKEDTVLYKKALAGLLVEVQAQVFYYLNILESGEYNHDQVIEILQFVQKSLFCKNPETKLLEDSVLAIYLINKLKRPIRVCGVVKNTGEPGGGPFLAFNPDGTISPQILESSQIDMNNKEYKEMFLSGTHFNPVDLICAVYDHNGDKYDLLDFVDSETGFISNKSQNGKELKALELPGLWNGAMSDWNTIFVEVPSSTFNPVKTVNDLLRDQHQANS